ncbi:DUF599 domain-containing protein [Phenylobacterium sp.]|jgi:uncharacterized membrane protein|uniref:DUF599 domain-containing protein n=1 Tax=Phenylobacterium sp. TaxID=1871053 RepID=UPI002F9317F4
MPVSPVDLAAFGLFLVCWLAYQPLLGVLSKQRGGVINTDMRVIRGAWMRNMVARENRFMDGQLLGHALNSASFFASSNLILIAAAAGALFGGEDTFRSVSALVVIRTASRFLFEFQLALVLVCLARGLLDFIWSIRQMNYCIATVGAVPDSLTPEETARFGDIAARLLNPALSSFNSGIRGYYFAIAAGAWLFGPYAFMTATAGAMVLLLWRQRRSPAAKAISDLRRLIEATPRRAPAPDAPSSSASPQ